MSAEYLHSTALLDERAPQVLQSNVCCLGIMLTVLMHVHLEKAFFIPILLLALQESNQQKEQTAKELHRLYLLAQEVPVQL